jgi:predicted glycoside hydrolase/deacetylase ChbG (UPF0249 family)
MVDRHRIVNADDFGDSTSINRGSLDFHTGGVVTGTSLMVTGRAVAEAFSMSRDPPRVGIGLHWHVGGVKTIAHSTRRTWRRCATRGAGRLMPATAARRLRAPGAARGRGA